MKVLITQREAADAYGEAVDILEGRYVVYFARMGISVRPVSNFAPDLEQMLEAEPFDGLILTGGGDVSEQFYRQPLGRKVQKNRDRTEKQLIEFFVKAGKPILAICRGMQYVNGLWGGKVSRLDCLPVTRPIGKDHSVEMNGELWMVNQYHDDGIYMQDLAGGLLPLAVDRENGVVEAFRAERELILGLQWHPERPFFCKEAQQKTAELIQKFFRQEEGVK